MDRKTKLIFACDIPDRVRGLAVITKVAPEVDVIKVGLETMTTEMASGETLARIYRQHAQGLQKKTFWDAKLHDIESVMRNSSRNIVRGMGCDMFTLHASASDDALTAAANETVAGTWALAVTVLTDLDDAQCVSRFLKDSRQAVADFASFAYDCGIRGFVCSGREIEIIRKTVNDPGVVIVTPGIRPSWAATTDEQKRITTPTQAAQAGADYVVVGRPIYNPPLGYTEASAARQIQQELRAV